MITIDSVLPGLGEGRELIGVGLEMRGVAKHNSGITGTTDGSGTSRSSSNV